MSYRTFLNAIGKTDAEMLTTALRALPPNRRDPSEDERCAALIGMFDEIENAPDDANGNIVYWSLVPEREAK